MTLAAEFLSIPERLLWPIYAAAKETPIYILTSIFTALLGLAFLAVPSSLQLFKLSLLLPETNHGCQIYLVLHLIAPKPRLPYPSEKTYLTTNPDGSISSLRKLPCWYDRWLAEGKLSESYPATMPAGFPVPATGAIEPAEVEMSVVVPAYNEEKRIVPALDEMVTYLDEHYGRPEQVTSPRKLLSPAHHRTVFKLHEASSTKAPAGYEIIVVNDGSRDRTVDVVLDFARKRGLHDVVRVVTLVKNRGKGGGVTHGLRHVRGEYAVFADADGASRFSDLAKLVEGCKDVVDGSNRGVAIGSRAHLVGSEAVVKVCLCLALF
jgi:dolichyl-phosphate beta-glucosyltransferase